jgi:aspartate/glutamate racemase
MIKKVINQIKKVFIPKSEFIEETPKKVEKKQASYTGVVAPITTPTDSWFSEPVKTEKVIAYEKHVAQKIEEQKFVEAAQPKKESEDIHQQMYDRVTKYWGTWQEELPGGSENFQSGPGGWNSGTGMGQFK